MQQSSNQVDILLTEEEEESRLESQQSEYLSTDTLTSKLNDARKKKAVAVEKLNDTKKYNWKISVVKHRKRK